MFGFGRTPPFLCFSERECYRMVVVFLGKKCYFCENGFFLVLHKLLDGNRV